MAKNQPIDSLDTLKPELDASLLLIGRNRCGLWVVFDPLGVRGGLFSSRAAAFRFATMDHGRPRAAIMVPYPLEFDLGEPTAANDALPIVASSPAPSLTTGRLAESIGANAYV